MNRRSESLLFSIRKKGEISIGKCDFQVLRLTESFFAAYPKEKYPEILEKKDRPYHCIIFEAGNDYFICVPYRTEIKHPYAFHFKKSNRSMVHKSGLDYTKIVIVNKSSYLDTENIIIDKDEYIETVQNIDKIKKEAIDFVQNFLNHVTGAVILHPSEYKRRYQYSPLKYFLQELGLSPIERFLIF